MKRLVWLSIVLVLALTTTASVAFAGSPNPATNTFDGVADPGDPGFPVPIRITGGLTVVDGQFALPYEYSASGMAKGNLPGMFTYLEQGYIFVALTGDPDVPLVPTGDGKLLDATFTLTPNRPGVGDVVISHQDPDAFTSTGLSPVTSKVADLGGAMGNVGKLAAPTGSEVVHNAFTFQTDVDTYMGYANADWSRFSITLTFGY